MKLPILLLPIVVMTNPLHAADAMPGRAPHSANPILPGYYADPSAAATATARYLRLVFPEDVKGSDISLFEWATL